MPSAGPGSRSAPPRSRRSPGEVRTALLRSAIEEFSANGYHATTVQDIARSAGLGMSAVYNHFESKQSLFEAAVLEPFLRFLEEFSETWRQQREQPWDELRLMSALIENLYDNLRSHRKALVEVAAEHGRLNASITDSIRQASTRMFSQVRIIGEEEARRRKFFRPEGVEMSIRLTVAMVISVAVYDDLVVPAGPRPSREELIEQMARYAIWGVAREPRPG
ncbi:MAG TPA: helix-turn-helix domain-containing protein [Pseudonocardia sp.]